jgi:hypothetical protein
VQPVTYTQRFALYRQPLCRYRSGLSLGVLGFFIVNKPLPDLGE